MLEGVLHRDGGHHDGGHHDGGHCDGGHSYGPHASLRRRKRSRTSVAMALSDCQARDADARTWRAQERGAALSDPAPAACTLLLRPPESMPTPLPHVHRCGRCPANTSYQPCCAARLLSLSRMYPVPCTPTPEVGPPRTPPTHATWTTRDRTRRAPRPCTQGGARTSPRAHPNPANTPPAEVGPRSDLDAEDALHLLLASDLA